MPADLYGRTRRRETFFPAAALGTQVAREDPSRIVLIISMGGGQRGAFTTVPSGAAANQGWWIGTAGSPHGTIELYHPEAGSLVGAPWFENSGIGGDVTVIEIIMDTDPRPEANPNASGRDSL